MISSISCILSFLCILLSDNTISGHTISVAAAKKNYPIVLLHGITSDKTELTGVANWLMENLPNKVFNLEIGNGKFDSLFKPMSWQLSELCNTIYNIPDLEKGFHFIGMSQGGLLARGYVEKCNKYPVKNLITWVTPHAGVYGFNGEVINFNNIYTLFYQRVYSFAGYWKDPYRYENYLSSATYLPDLNNEINNVDSKKNKANILEVDNFVMIWSPNDDVINPPESGKFSFYQIISDYLTNTNTNTNTNANKQYIITNTLPVIDLFNSTQFINDLLGLKTLYNAGKLHILETNCTHSGHKTEACFPQLEKLTFPFLV
jgi:palmitoyl-protein thioesterase